MSKLHFPFGQLLAGLIQTTFRHLLHRIVPSPALFLLDLRPFILQRDGAVEDLFAGLRLRIDTEVAKAFELEKAAAAKLKGFGVKIVEDVDKKSFATVSDPLLDKLAKELGPHADKLKTLIREIN